MKRWGCGWALAVGVLLVSCHAKPLKGWVGTAADPHIVFAQELPDDAVVPVDDAQIAQAVDLLAQTQWLRATGDEVRKMCACKIDGAMAGDWYLVRAVRNNVRGGHYVVHNLHGAYDIHYSVLSHWSSSSEKAGVLLRLPAAPKTISAGASVVE